MERVTSFIEDVESAETPHEAINLLGRLSLRHIINGSVNLGRNLLTIAMNGDTGEMLRASANHLH